MASKRNTPNKMYEAYNNTNMMDYSNRDGSNVLQKGGRGSRDKIFLRAGPDSRGALFRGITVLAIQVIAYMDAYAWGYEGQHVPYKTELFCR